MTRQSIICRFEKFNISFLEVTRMRSSDADWERHWISEIVDERDLSERRELFFSVLPAIFAQSCTQEVTDLWPVCGTACRLFLNARKMHGLPSERSRENGAREKNGRANFGTRTREEVVLSAVRYSWQCLFRSRVLVKKTLWSAQVFYEYRKISTSRRCPISIPTIGASSLCFTLRQNRNVEKIRVADARSKSAPV